MSEFSIKDFFDSFILDDTKKIMKDHPYQSFAILSIGIEIIGKCIDHKKLDVSGHSEQCFYDAINTCASLEKYRIYNTTDHVWRHCIFRRKVKHTNELYKMIRCGLAHSFRPQGTIFLAPGMNDFAQNIIGCQELLEDVSNAWKEVKTGAIKVKLNINNKCFYIDGDISGSTQYNVTKSV